MSDKQYPSNLYLESAATNVDFAKQVSVEAVVVMAKELLALRNQPVSQHYKLPDGWKLVPVEPTDAMCEVKHVGVDVYVGMARDDCYSIGGRDAANVYKAMLAAAPEPE